MTTMGTDIIRTAAARILKLAAAVAVIVMSTGCERRMEKVGAIYSCDDYTVYPDSFVSQSLTLTAKGDSMIIRTDTGERLERVHGTKTDGITMSGSDGLITYLFNRETHVPSGDYDEFTPYGIYVSECLLDCDSAAMAVDSRIAGGEVVEYAKGAYRWPVAMADATWGVAAAAVSATEADEKRAHDRAEALKKLIDCDIYYVYDRREGLFAGVPPEMDIREMPDWAGAGDAAAMMTLEGNISRLAAMRWVNTLLPGSYEEEFVAELGENIAKRFWIPNLGMLSQTLYQRPYPVSVTAADNIAQALAVVTDGTGEAMASRIISNTPMTEGRVPATYPDQGLEGESRRGALTSAMWAIASAMEKNGDAWALSYASLVAKSVTDGYALRLLQGVTLRTVFGLMPEADGLRIQPYVHDMLGDYHRVSGLKYRNGTLNVTVRGKGDVVSTFSIDGVINAEGKVGTDIEGEHEVEIVLAGSTGVSDGINVAERKQMPRAPEVTVESPRKYSIKSGETGYFIVYLNGAVDEIIGRGQYELYNAAPVTAVSFEADVANTVTGYASKNRLYIPAKDSVSIACSAVAPTGGRVLANKDLASKHVESTRYKNARIVFDYESASGGGYYVRLRYLDGLGIVNKNRQYALRVLKVNGEQAGVMVLSQRGPEMWSPAEDWASMCGTTEPIAVELARGRNEIAVEYFTPNGVAGFDHDGNTAIPVALELIKR